jgi:hypothetical protein
MCLVELLKHFLQKGRQLRHTLRRILGWQDQAALSSPHATAINHDTPSGRGGMGKHPLPSTAPDLAAGRERPDGPVKSHQPTPSVDTIGEPEDLLENKRWLGLVEECVTLFDELDRHSASFDPPRREVAEHVCYRLQEILERSGVTLISGDSTFDRNRHRAEPAAAGTAPGARIAETLSSGFSVGRRVLRRARVRLEGG